LNNENELSGYKRVGKMRAETDQDWQHQREVLRQNDFVRSNEEATKNTRSKKLFSLPTISFTLDVPVIINM